MISIKQIRDFFAPTPSNGDLLVYDGPSKKWKNRTAYTRIWAGTATVVDGGTWSVNYSSAGFTEPPIVTATGVATGTTAGAKTLASLNTVTATGATGYSSTSTTAGAIVVTVLTNSSAGAIINVIAVGR